MEETQDEENARLLAPYVALRNELAHEVLELLLSGRHEESAIRLQDYQVACLGLDSAMQICGWFDSGTAAEHIEVVPPVV